MRPERKKNLCASWVVERTGGGWGGWWDGWYLRGRRWLLDDEIGRKVLIDIIFALWAKALWGSISMKMEGDGEERIARRIEGYLYLMVTERVLCSRKGETSLIFGLLCD